MVYVEAVKSFEVRGCDSHCCRKALAVDGLYL